MIRAAVDGVMLGVGAFMMVYGLWSILAGELGRGVLVLVGGVLTFRAARDSSRRAALRGAEPRDTRGA